MFYHSNIEVTKVVSYCWLFCSPNPHISVVYELVSLTRVKDFQWSVLPLYSLVSLAFAPRIPAVLSKEWMKLEVDHPCTISGHCFSCLGSSLDFPKLMFFSRTSWHTLEYFVIVHPSRDITRGSSFCLSGCPWVTVSCFYPPFGAGRGSDIVCQTWFICSVVCWGCWHCSFPRLLTAPIGHWINDVEELSMCTICITR